LPRPEPDLAPGAGADPFPAYFEALEARHRSSLRFAEIRRGLLALSSLYVERRSRMAEGAALSGAGKRAAFALYYAPLHFLVVREIVRALAPVLGRPRSILDLGCGTGAAGAAWALAGDPRSRVLGVDTSGWAVAEARWTLDRLGLAGRVSRGDAVSALGAARDRSAVLAAFTVNELGETDRGRMLEGLLQAGR
jgi:predicted TPR repeat methyltransferase